VIGLLFRVRMRIPPHPAISGLVVREGPTCEVLSIRRLETEFFYSTDSGIVFQGHLSMRH